MGGSEDERCRKGEAQDVAGDPQGPNQTNGLVRTSPVESLPRGHLQFPRGFLFFFFFWGSTWPLSLLALVGPEHLAANPPCPPFSSLTMNKQVCGIHTKISYATHRERTEAGTVLQGAPFHLVSTRLDCNTPFFSGRGEGSTGIHLSLGG